MKRRKFLESASILCSAALPFGARANPDAGATEWRQFEVTTSLTLPAASGITRIWVPIPSVDTPYQRVLDSTWTGNQATSRMAVDRDREALMVFAEWDRSEPAPTFSIVTRVETRDHAVDLSQPHAVEPLSAAQRERYLRATELIPTDGLVREQAREITADARGDLEQARAIYEWIVDNTFRDPKVRGCGTGDIRFMLESGDLGGKCADLNALYVGLARSVGLPARDLYGIRIADSRLGYKSLGKSGDVSKAQHCRAEVWLEQFGWMPVDPADVRKVVLEESVGLTLDSPVVKRARARLFGSWEMNWMAYNAAHDVTLPQSTGRKLGYLMYPQAENAGGRRDSLSPDSFQYRITASEVS